MGISIVRLATLAILSVAASAALPAACAVPDVLWSQSRSTDATIGYSVLGTIVPPHAMTDPVGNFIAAYSEFQSAYSCTTITKYAANGGDVLWSTRACDEWMLDQKVDSHGNAIVATSVPGITSAVRIAKYSGVNGAVLWEQRFVAGPNSIAVVGVDAHDDVLVAVNGTTTLQVARCASADGAVMMNRTNLTGLDRNDPVAMAVDENGDGYVAVRAQHNAYPYNRMWYVARVSRDDGSFVWRADVDHGYGRIGTPASLALDATGSVVAAGTMNDGRSEMSELVKWRRSDGVLQWDLQSEPGTFSDVTTGPSGEIYVGGAMWNPDGQSRDLGVAHYRPDGTLAWVSRYVHPLREGGAAYSVALDVAGQVVAVGTSGYSPKPRLMAVDAASGAVAWTRGFVSSASDVPLLTTVSASGVFLVVGSGAADGSSGITALKYGLAPVDRTLNGHGLWWAAPAGSQSGWGLNIAQQGDKVFATWFTFDAFGSPTWYVMPDGIRGADGNTYAGMLYSTTGPPLGASFDPSHVTVKAAGQGAIELVDADHAIFMHPSAFGTTANNLVRQAFGPTTSCELGGSAGSAPNYSDLWWASPAGSEPGWGANVVQQGDTIFLSWFTYGPGNRNVWYIASAMAKTAPGDFSGTLYQVNGPRASERWDPATLKVVAVGTARLHFSGDSNGTFSYTVNGLSESKPITRQVFAQPGSVCH